MKSDALGGPVQGTVDTVLDIPTKAALKQTFSDILGVTIEKTTVCFCGECNDLVKDDFPAKHIPF